MNLSINLSHLHLGRDPMSPQSPRSPVSPGTATGRRREKVGKEDPRDMYEKPRGINKLEKEHVSDDEADRNRGRSSQQVISIGRTDDGSKSTSSYVATVRKVSFIGEPYVYENLSVKPLIPFFKHLARAPIGPAKTQRSTAGRLRLLLADVIVYGEGEGPSWYYSSTDGYVYRTDTFSEKHILKRFGNTERDTDLVAVLKRSSYENPAGNEITLLDSKDLRTMVSNPPPGMYCIQKYVKCKGPKAFISRTVWKAGSPTSVWIISNRKNFEENIESDFKYRYCTCTEVMDGTTIFKQNGKAVEETEVLILELVSYLERTTQPRVKFSEMVADFIKDEDGNWWLLQIKAFQLEPSSLAAQMSQVTDRGVTDDLANLDEEEDAAAAGAAQKSGRPTDYTKLTRCKSCTMGYQPSELTYSMTMKMILDTEDHLKKRGKSLRWFNRPELRALMLDPYLMYRSYAVCKNCYDMFLTEQKLMQVEAEFAKAIGVPQPRNADDASTAPIHKGLELGFVARDETERRKMATRDINQKIPRGEPVKLEKNPSLRPVPPVLTIYRLLTYFHEIQEFPRELAHFQQNFYLEYTIFNYTTRMVANVTPGFSSVPIHKLRVFHFMGDADSLKMLLESQQRIEVHLFTKDRKHVGSAMLPLKQFESGVIEKLDLFQLFNTHELGMARIKVTLGIVRGEDIASSLHKLHMYQGVYLPEPTFFTADPLPKEWMDLIPTKDRQRKAISAGVMGATERNVPGSPTDRDGSPQVSPRGADIERVVAASLDQDVLQVISVTLELHSAHDLQLSNKDFWAVECKLFKSHFVLENITPVSISAPLNFNTQYQVLLRASARMLREYFGFYPNVDVTMICRSRSGTIGKAVIPMTSSNAGHLGPMGMFGFGIPGLGSRGTVDIQQEGGNTTFPWLSYAVTISIVDPYSLGMDCVLDIDTGLPDNVIVDEEVECGIQKLRVLSDADMEARRNAAANSGNESSEGAYANEIHHHRN